jgi:hypothetical protein
MLNIHEGQCGLCTHFGEPHNAEPKLVQIRQKHQAPADLVEECGHPKNVKMHLMVTPVSGCTGFTPAKMN